MEKESNYTPRPDNLLEAMGIDFKGLSEEERRMKELLAEEYKKRQESLLEKIRRWREGHPKATLGDSIRALYQEIEEE